MDAHFSLHEGGISKNEWQKEFDAGFFAVSLPTKTLLSGCASHQISSPGFEFGIIR